MTGAPGPKPAPLQSNGKLIAGGAFLLLMFLSVIVLSLFVRLSEPDERPVDPARAAIAEQFMRTIERSDYVAAYAMLGPDLQRGFTEATFQGTWERLLGNIGSVQLRSGAHSGGSANPETVAYTVQFENSVLDVRLNVSATGKIDDFAFDTPNQQVLARLANQSNYVERDTWVGDLQLPGLLTSPARLSQAPAVVLLPDAGIQDHDQTRGDGRLFRDLAYGLAVRGIVVLRYQKRPLSGDTATIDDEYVDDAVAALHQLRQIPGIDPKRIYVAGYGMGGRVAPRVARRVDDIAGLILLAADARPMKTSLASRLASVQPPPDYWQALEQYDPIATARDSGRPVLLIQGGRDSQVTPAGDLARWESGLAGCDCMTTKRYPALDHSLLATGTGQDKDDEKTARIPEMHAPVQLIEDIVNWIIPPPPGQ